MNHDADLQTLVDTFSNERPPETEKTPPKPPTNRAKVNALKGHIEQLRSENYPYESIVGLLERHGVKLSVGTLKAYLREARTEQTSDGELAADAAHIDDAQPAEPEEIEAVPLDDLGSKEKVVAPRPARSKSNHQWSTPAV